MSGNQRKTMRVQGVGWAVGNQDQRNSKQLGSKEANAEKNQNQHGNFSAPHLFVKSSKQDEWDDDEDLLSKIVALRMETAKSVVEFPFIETRVKLLSETRTFMEDGLGVVYWMSRDSRVQDNWAMLYAQRLALKLKVPLHVCFCLVSDNWAMLYAQRLALKLEVPLHVCFCLVPKFLDATYRHFAFMLKGLQEVEQECKQLDISFHLLNGFAEDVLPRFVKDNKIGAVIVDFSALHVPLQWVKGVMGGLPADVPFYQVDAHNIVPNWEASDQLEYAAYTIRSKIKTQLPVYLTEFPPVDCHRYKAKTFPQPVDWDSVLGGLEVDRSVGEVEWAVPGTTAGLRQLESFLKHRLWYYGTKRNEPNANVQSHMSPWYHFGQVSVQRAMLLVQPYRSRCKESVEMYLEQGIIRRELADNFCYHNKNYDSFEGADDWAKQTLNEHTQDKREYVYSREQLEQAQTHDDLWNATQTQMEREGKMHGFLRMYWAKKILEWTDTPERALQDAIYLNDRYSLDGRDPSGYVGIMWSICGIHDKQFPERPVYGRVRYMSYYGCLKKFDVAAFISKYK